MVVRHQGSLGHSHHCKRVHADIKTFAWMRLLKLSQLFLTSYVSRTCVIPDELAALAKGLIDCLLQKDKSSAPIFSFQTC